MIEIINYLLLTGYISNTYGRIGIVVAKDGGISHVFKHSPAADIGLERKDIIISADGVKGTSQITGDAGSFVRIVVKHNDKEYTYILPRVAESEVSY